MFDRILHYFSSQSNDEHSSHQDPIRQLYKLILIGDEHKKNVLFRNNLGLTLGKDLINSIGTDFCVRSILLNSHETVAQIWEISRNEKFSSLRSKFMQGSRGAILIYDAKKPQTLLSFADILNEMYERNFETIEEYKSYPILIIACNTTEDLLERSIIEDFTDKLVFKTLSSVTITIPDCDDFVSMEGFVDDLLSGLDMITKTSAS